MYLVIVLFALTASSLAQVPGMGPCPVRAPIENFDTIRILGQWYGYAAYPDCNPIGRCQRDEHLLNEDGSMELVGKRLSIIPNVWGLEASHNRGVHTSGGRYRITTPEDATFVNQTVDFYSTDYVSYVVRGSCVNVGSSSLNYAWISTRSPNPSQDTVQTINELIDRLDIQREYLVPSDQTKCPVEF